MIVKHLDPSHRWNTWALDCIQELSDLILAAVQYVHTTTGVHSCIPTSFAVSSLEDTLVADGTEMMLSMGADFFEAS